MLTLKPNELRPASKKPSKFRPPPPTQKPISRSSHLKQAHFGPHTVNFDPPHKKGVTFDPNTKIKSNSISHGNQVNFDATTWVNPIPSLKSCHFRCLHTKTKLITIHILKPSSSRPPRKNQVNSDPYTEVKLFSIPTVNHANYDAATPKRSWFRSLH